MTKEKKNKYARFMEDAPSDEDAASLAGLIGALDVAERAMSAAAEQATSLAATHRELAEKLIPEKMEELGIAAFTTAGGTSVKVEDALHVTPKKDDREWVLDWLEKRGQAALIKRTVTAALNKGEEKNAEEIASVARGCGADVKTERKVASGTLKKYVKGLLAAGKKVPSKRLGVFQYKRAKITDRAADPVFDGE